MLLRQVAAPGLDEVVVGVERLREAAPEPEVVVVAPDDGGRHVERVCTRVYGRAAVAAQLLEQVAAPARAGEDEAADELRALGGERLRRVAAVAVPDDDRGLDTAPV